MGNNHVQSVAPLDKYDIIVNCRKVEGYGKINQERFIKAFMGAEKNMVNELKSTKPELLDIHEISLKVTNSLSAEKKIKATSFLIKFIKQLEDNSTLICEAVNRRMFDEMLQYQTIIENIVYVTRQLNMTNARFVEEMTLKYMGGFVLKEIYKFEKVDIGLKACFATLEPTPKEKKFFLQKFLHRHKLEEKFDCETLLGNKRMSSEFREFSLFSNLIDKIETIGV